jgi:hypothetical protein
MKVSVRGVVGWTLLIAAVCTVLGLGGVLDRTHAALLGCLGFAAVLMRAGSADQWKAEWPGRPFASRAGGRGAVSDLGWQVFGQDGRVRPHVVERVRRLAAARLALLGVDLDDPGQSADVERLLGAQVATGLADRRPPTAHTLQTWLDAIDRISHERTTP